MPAVADPAAAQRPGGALRLLDAKRRAAVAHKRRCKSLGAPSEAELARMLREYQARGGAVTQCPEGYALPVQNGAGREARRWTP